MNIITIYPSKSAKIFFEGYFYDKTFYVYLSSTNNNNFPFVNCVNLFPSNARLSSAFPPFSGYPIESYNIINNNYINVFVGNLSAIEFFYDVIIGNNAGYSKLTSKDFILYTSYTPTPTPSPTETPTPTPSLTPSPTETPTPTPSPTPTTSPAPTPSPTTSPTPTPTPSPTTSPTPTPTPSPTPAFSFFVSAAGSDPAFAEDGVQKISIVSPNPYNYTDSIYYNNGGSALDFYTISIYVDNNFRSLINYTSDREGTNFGYRSDGVTSPYPQFIGVFANNTNIYFTT